MLTEVYTMIPTHSIFVRRTDEEYLKSGVFSMPWSQLLPS